MPTFSIQTPRGDTVDIDAPDQAAAVNGAKTWDMEDHATSEAQRLGVDPKIALGILHQESGAKPDGPNSAAGAIGPMQLMPGTAKDLGVDPNDPYQNITGGLTYYKQQRDRFGRDDLALAAYNAGPGAVQQHGGIPPYPETQNYVKSILGANYAPPTTAASPAAPAVQPSPPDDNLPPVTDAETKQPYATPAVQKGLQALLANGQIDPSAAPGSKDFPRGWKPGFEAGPGEWYVGQDGQLSQKPDLSPGAQIADYVQGYGSGLMKSTASLADDIISRTNPIAAALPIAQKVSDIAGAISGLPQVKIPQFSLPATIRPDEYTPQSSGGRYAETGGEMTLNALAPGTAFARAAAVVAPTIVGQGMQDLAARHGASPLIQQLARTGGMIGGSFLSGARANLPSGIPKVTADDLRTQAKSLYTDMRNRGVEFTPGAVQSLNKGLADTLDAEGRNLYPQHALWTNQVATTLKSDPSVEALDKVRSKAQQALTTPTANTTPDQLRVGGAIIDQIDQFMAAAARHPSFMTNATPQNAERVAQDLTQARDLWRRMRNVETVSNLADSAGIQNATSHMGGNAQNMTARKLRTFIDPSTNKSLAGLSPEEAAQLNRVVLGTPLTQILKVVGNLSPHKGIGAMIAGMGAGGALHGGGLGALVPTAAVAALGYGANRSGVALQKANLNRLLNMIASGQPGSPGGITYTSPHPLAYSGALLNAASALPDQPQ